MSVSKREIAYILRNVNPQAIWGPDKILCPFHDDHSPSLHVYPDGLYCFTCGRQVTALQVLTEGGVPFKKAIEFLKSYMGKGPARPRGPVNLEPIPVERVRNWTETLLGNEEALRYLVDRGVPPGAVDVLSLGWTEGRTYSIPHVVNGVVENVKFRIHPEFLMDDEAKYTCYPHRPFTQPYPYDFFTAEWGDSERVFVTEGEFDAIVLLDADFPAVALPSGVTHKLSKFVNFFTKFKEVFLVFDMDDAGSRAVERALRPHARTGLSEKDLIHVDRLESVAWNPAWGKDVTDARRKLVPYMRQRYVA